MTDSPLRVAVIIGSTRQGRTGPTVAAWFAREAAGRDDLTVELLDPVADDPLGPRLAAADAFVIVTPEYNHSFPAPLKTVIDAHGTEWAAKPVAFVSYGGISGGLRAVEHLRGVFAELHTVTIRDTVSFHNVWDCFQADGKPTEPTACGAAARTLLDRLSWWGWSLRAARATRPYQRA